MGLPAAVDAALGARVASVIPCVVQVWNPRRGFAAGILWRPGLVVTSAHGLASGLHRVTLWNGETLPAEPEVVDEEIDLAVLRLPRPEGPAIPWRDPSTLPVGALVLALGHPWGERYALRLGVFSGWVTAITRGGRALRLLRTDAALAPGDSGGPLLDAAGRVVGILTMVVGGDQGLAIPADRAEALVAGDRPSGGMASSSAHVGKGEDS